jgi:UDP-N-acetylmuramoyl-L-alanyl-D-glutamate--2,6-diaminopimelate ligase
LIQEKIEVNEMFLSLFNDSSNQNGHDYIQKAIELGAVVIVCDTFPENLKKELHTYRF